MLVYRRVVGEMMIEPYGCGIHIVFSCIQMYPSEILKTAGYPDTAIITNTWEILGCPLYVNRDVNTADKIFTTETRPTISSCGWTKSVKGCLKLEKSWDFYHRLQLVQDFAGPSTVECLSCSASCVFPMVRLESWRRRAWCAGKTSSVSSILKLM